MEHTQRGFGIYGRFEDCDRNEVRVQESSFMGEPSCWVLAKDRQGRTFETGVVGVQHGVVVVSPRLNVSQARELIAALQLFVNESR